MRRVTKPIVHSLRDQLRGVRYSVRAEAATPGSVFPLIQQAIDFGPISMIETAIRAPALRVADGLFTHVEHAATDLLDRVDPRVTSAFPVAIWTYGRSDHRGVDFSETVYRELTRMLRGYGAKNMLVSEHALDTVWSSVLARHGDAKWPTASAGRGASVTISAALAAEFARIRPVQRMDLLEPKAGAPRHLMLAPNVYCGLVIGLATALVSAHPELAGQGQEVIDSADATVDARFDRFKQALDSKAGVTALATEFEAVLPYLP